MHGLLILLKRSDRINHLMSSSHFVVILPYFHFVNSFQKKSGVLSRPSCLGTGASFASSASRCSQHPRFVLIIYRLLNAETVVVLLAFLCRKG